MPNHPISPISLDAQAAAVAMVTRVEAIRAVRKLSHSQIEMLLDQLRAAEMTLRPLAARDADWEVR